MGKLKKIHFLGFSQKEIRVLALILLMLLIFLVPNLLISLRKRRDAQRKADIRDINQAVEAFVDENGFVPRSENGQIVACDGQIDQEGVLTFRPCQWGIESWPRLDPDKPLYLERIPSDPQHDQGARYYFVSNGKHYQLFAGLEGKKEAEFDSRIESRQLPCGTRICNFGLAPWKTPLDKSLEEYENELLEQEKGR